MMSDMKAMRSKTRRRPGGEKVPNFFSVGPVCFGKWSLFDFWVLRGERGGVILQPDICGGCRRRSAITALKRQSGEGGKNTGRVLQQVDVVFRARQPGYYVLKHTHTQTNVGVALERGWGGGLLDVR